MRKMYIFHSMTHFFSNFAAAAVVAFAVAAAAVTPVSANAAVAASSEVSAAVGSAADGVTRDLAGLVLQDLDYTDHMQTLPNYDRGFYNPQVLHLKPNGTKPVETPYGKLLHLRAEISAFSSQAWLGVDTTGGKRDTTWGESQDLTEDALDVLQKSFDNIRSFGGKVIVRICYDPWYNGHSNTTPEHKWVMRHVEQLAPVLSKNTDVILALEMGMHGAYGEMHSDTAITYPRVAAAVNRMLQLTPPELKILTRTGNYSAAVLGFENWAVDFHIDGDVFKRIAEAKGDTMYRVGMFNDGYLGTQFDYGTWGEDCEKSICREEGVAWLEKYSINTPYGGEALTTASGYKVINTPEFLAYEGFRTHTSYLNIQWNNTLIDSWKKAHFTGSDYEYDGTKIDSLTGFKYVDDHLGYRFVLRESWLPDTVYADEPFRAKLKIQNVGFGNLTQKRAARILFVEDVGDANVCPSLDTIPLENVDFRDVHSRTIAVNGSDTAMTFDGTNELKVEGGFSGRGNYEVYLEVDGVAFANGLRKMVTCEGKDDGVFLGEIFAAPEKKPLGIVSGVNLSGVPKNRLSHVERADQKIQVRDNRGNSREARDSRASNTRGTTDKLYRVNGKIVR